MKFLATILCIYILCVSAMPCCCDNGMTGYGGHQTEQSSADTAHSGCSDTCSPFCLCNTCGGFTIIPLTAGLRIAPQTFSDTDIAYLPSTYHSPSLKGVWQPPQL